MAYDDQRFYDAHLTFFTETIQTKQKFSLLQSFAKYTSQNSSNGTSILAYRTWLDSILDELDELNIDAKTYGDLWRRNEIQSTAHYAGICTNHHRKYKYIDQTADYPMYIALLPATQLPGNARQPSFFDPKDDAGEPKPYEFNVSSNSNASKLKTGETLFPAIDSFQYMDSKQALDKINDFEFEEE